MFHDHDILFLILGFVFLNILLPLAAFLFWVIIKVPNPIKRFVKKRFYHCRESEY